MKKVTAIFAFAAFTTIIAAAASTTLLSTTYTVPAPVWGTESISVSVTTAASPVVLAGSAGPNSTMSVYATTAITLTISKYEEWGGYAHGISYWVGSGSRVDVLYAYAGNGSYSIAVPANTLLKIELYRINVFWYEAIAPVYAFQTLVDTTAPAISFSLDSGTYAAKTIIAGLSDTYGAGVDTGATSFVLKRSPTGETLSSGNGASVTLSVEGSYTLTFTAKDLLGNSASASRTYTIDLSPPVLSGITPSASPRSDGALDFRISFDLSDPVAGLNQATLQVQLTPLNGLPWSYSSSGVSIAPKAGGGVTVTLPVIPVARNARLGLHVVVADAVGNVLDSNDTAYSISLPPAAVVASVNEGAVAGSLVSLDGSTRLPRYVIPILFDKPREAFVSSGVSRYTLTRRVLPSGTPEIVMDLAPAEFSTRLANDGAAAVYQDVLTDAAYAHKQIVYSLLTTFSVSGSETTAVSGTASMPNIEGWLVRLQKDGTPFPDYLSGAPSYPSLRLPSYSGVMATIGPDPEGDPLSMRIEFRRPDASAGTYPDTGWMKQALLSDVFAGGPDGIYECRFIVTEDGSSTSQNSLWFSINVNVNAGSISGDETWSSDQILAGSLEILDGGALHIAQGVKVTVAHVVERINDQPRPEGSPTITVRPGGYLELQNDSAIEPAGWSASSSPGNGWFFWGGIFVEGRLDAGSAAVRGALQGVVALSGSAVALNRTQFQQCRTGVHAVGPDSAPVINAAVFSNSARYGIKEDSGASPIVTLSTFAGNTYDYYDELLTVVDAAGINDLPPGTNYGNYSIQTGP